MSKSSEVTYLRGVESPASRKQPESLAVHEVCNAATKGLKELLQSMFDAIDDSLFELANNARSNNEQNRFFETMREVRIKRRSIEAQFFEQLARDFSPKAVLEQSKTLKQQAMPDALSLVDDKNMEQNVAVTSMATKANANFKGPLLSLQRRVTAFYGAPSNLKINFPLDPLRLSENILTALECLEIELKEQLLILKQFDRFVMSNLGETLDQTIRVLNAHSAEDAITHAPPHKHSAPEHNTQTAEPSTNLLPALQSLLEKQRQINRSDVGSDSNAIPARDLLVLLNNLQQQILTNSRERLEQAPLDIRSAVHSQVNREHSRISELDEDLINLVAMLFEFILEDYNLAPSMQVLISRLQIPILKVVVQDKTFFNSSRHPARNLLNSLAKAGIGWTEQSSKPKDPLYLKIQEMVNRVLDEFDGDTNLFAELNRDFGDFLRKEERRASIVEQRTREAEEGRIRTHRAHKKVEETLSKLILSAHHAIPDVVVETLKNGWSRVMFLAYLKDADEHQWQHAVELPKELIWCLQPLSSAKDRQRWITIAPKLLKDLEAGLEGVAYNNHNLTAVMGEIKHELTRAFKDNGLKPQNTALRERASKLIENSIKKPLDRVELAMTPTPEQNQNENAAEQSKPSDTKPDEAQQLAHKTLDSLAINSWVEFQLINGNKHRCKLSTHIAEADSYIFVNRMGLKPIEKTKQELLDDIIAGRVVLLEQGLIIDRALNAITSNLRNKNKP